MFIKIKLEPQNSKALLPLKKISYFAIDDDATIIDLKIKIEGYVDLPAERQEIRTLETVFENYRHVKEVCDVRGMVIMLYGYDEHQEFGEPQFVCFLQVYTNELAAEQQELEQRSKLSVGNIKTNTSSCSSSSVTLIASSDTDDDSENTGSDTSSASDLESDSSSDNSEASIRKKRSKHEKNYALQNKKLKVTAPSENQYPEPLCQYLDEFPKCSKQISSTAENHQPPAVKQDSNKSSDEKSISAPSTALGKSSDFAKLNENLVPKKHFQNFDNESTTTVLSTIQSNKITTTIDKENKSSIHPCYSIKPEIRDYLAIICTNDGTIIGKDEFEKLLAWFFNRFRTCEPSDNLQFDDKTALSLFDGKLWIACGNLNTFDWISASIVQYSIKTYKVLALNESRLNYEVVVPVVSGTKNILDIFDLLEKQNKNIVTLKWSVQSRQTLLAEDKDFNEKAVSTFCMNELLRISVDSESKKNLENLDFKLKYCFWQIVFKFI